MTEQKVFVASDESKSSAQQLRLFAFLAWLIAIGGEIFTILKLLHNEKLTALIIAIVIILILSVTGSLLWKKANRLDPPSEKDKTKFFIQSQLGAIMAVLAFLPLVIFIFTDKKLDGKTKGIAGAVAVVALLIAGITGVDFNPPSVEKYTNQINQQDSVLNILTPGNKLVYWTKEGNKYHIYRDCFHIKNKTDVTQGTIKESFDQRGISQLCLTCQSRAAKEKNLSSDELNNLIKAGGGNPADSTQ